MNKLTVIAHRDVTFAIFWCPVAIGALEHDENDALMQNILPDARRATYAKK